MRKLHHVRFNMPREAGERVREALAVIHCDQWWRPPPNERGLPSFLGSFESGDVRVSQLLSFIRSEGLRVTEAITYKYSDDELRKFPLLELSVDRDPIATDSDFGTTYDMSNACSQCGTGAVQTSPLMLPLQGLPRKAKLTLGTRFEILVGPILHQALVASQVTGLELRQALFYRNREPLPWWQFISTYEMPRMSKASKNLTRIVRPGWGCTTCNRDMHVSTGIEPLDLVYDAAGVDIGLVPDVVHTWECWGRSVLKDDPVRQLVRGFATPWILVKPKVFDILRPFKLGDLDFSPVRLA